MSLPMPPEPYASLIREWARSLRADNKSERTIRGYTDAARWFHMWCADPIAPPDEPEPDRWLAGVPAPPAEPDDVDVKHCRSFIAYRIKTTSPGNAHNNYRGMHAWFMWLIDEGEIAGAHPMGRMIPPHVPDKPPPIVPDNVMHRVLATCTGRDLINRRDEAIIRLFFDCGPRLSEIGNTDVDDYDLNVDLVKVVGKGGKPRAIPFSPKTGKAIGRYLRVRSRHPLAYLPNMWLADRNRGALAPNGIKHMLRRRGRLAGVNDEIGRNLHAHLGRHYSAHHAKASGMSDGDLMMLFGWASAEMPRRYGRSAAAERAHNAARRLRLGDRL